MKHFKSKNFNKLYKKLPAKVRILADKKYQQLRMDPTDPDVQFKNLKYRNVDNKPVWRARVGPRYRALAVEAEPGKFIWFWIGSHEAYNSMYNSSLNKGQGKHAP